MPIIFCERKRNIIHRLSIVGSSEELLAGISTESDKKKEDNCRKAGLITAAEKLKK